MDILDVDSVQSAANQRRLRRLRQFLRHERLSVAMALAESEHHSALRRPKQARAREEGERDEPRAEATDHSSSPGGKHSVLHV